MADITLTPSLPLAGHDRVVGGNRIVERDNLALVSAAIPLGGDKAFSDALLDGWSLPLPSPRRSAEAGEMRALRTGPDQILFVFPHTGPDARALVGSVMGPTAYTTDQTGAWVVLEIQGPETTAALERLCPLDLSTDAFPTGATGRTLMEHMGVNILRLAPDMFWLMAASSYAQSFLEAVETSYRNVVDS